MKTADVYFDGKYAGSVKNPRKFTDTIRQRRRKNMLPLTLNVSYLEHVNEVRVSTDTGRIRRPLIVIEGGKSKLTPEIVKKLENGELGWEELNSMGIIEYLDAEEEEDTLVALSYADITPDHTHLEIDHSVILGMSASLIPYPEHNRGDRVNYGAKMVGQSIGLYSYNHYLRSDTKSNILNYPQMALVKTITSKILGFDNHPSGHNIVVAVIPWEGYNMEDGIVMNMSSVQRGMFRSIYNRVYETQERRYWGGQEDSFGIPEKGIRGYRSEEAYKNLSEDGIIFPETVVKAGDVLVGKTSPLRFLGQQDDFTTDIEKIRESSLCIRHGEKGVIDTVIFSETVAGNRLVKIKVRDERVPELGDKFSSRHGQKGVIGLLLPQEDMPFSGKGVIPDIIFNPHAIPSRLTMGQILEILTGKAFAMKGERADATAFSGNDEKDIRSILLGNGFRPDGKETLYDGRTGERYDAQIYTGLCYYQKLDHMVANKIHARSRGPIALLTKQPTEGRTKEGGLRLGEMEKDAIIAHGAAMVLKERFSSDKTEIPICVDCGIVGIYDRVKNKVYCPVCGKSDIKTIEISHAFTLLLDELKSMLIYPKIRLEEMR